MYSFRALLVILISTFLSCIWAPAQTPSGVVKGIVKNEKNNRLAGVKVEVEEVGKMATTDSTGYFKFDLPVGVYIISFRYKEFNVRKKQVTLTPAKTEWVYVTLNESYELGTEVISEVKDPKELDKGRFLQVFPTKKIYEMPSFKSDVTSKLATLPGVTVNSEFSSQYRVRGGNFDENLIYVDDVEIYRPFLTRSGQQEGLGFVNPNLANDVFFSTGGFESRYGDKMSSVLDVTYKRPEDFHGSAEVGILNANLHFEGSTKNKKNKPYWNKFTYLLGARRYAISYLLNSLDTDGDYKPSFHDFQMLLTYAPKKGIHEPKIIERKNGTLDTLYVPTEKWKFSLLGNLGHNRYFFVPKGRLTQLGTITDVIQLRVAFVGQEISSYLTGQGALIAEHRPHTNLKLKFILSAFHTREKELFDVEGGYWLSDVNTNYGNEGFNEVTFDRGIGTNINVGRNFLNATVISAEHIGEWFPGKNFRHTLNWGVRVQNQLVNDRIKEWSGVDSAGYFTLQEHLRSDLQLSSFQYKAFIQDVWKLNKDNTFRLVYGSRFWFNSLSKEFLPSPRIQFVFDPTMKKVNESNLTDDEFRKKRRREIQIRLATGLYQQPAFYREMRAMDGNVNTRVKSQKAVHAIGGLDYKFRIWNRPFKLFTEVYYKYLDDLIPYEVDNVRIRYYPDRRAKGYTYGLDMKIIGEFIRGVDSWISLSVLKTAEDVYGDGKGYVPRPTDQRVNFSMYFMDELPINPTYKVHINFIYGTGLRVGPPRVFENRTAFKVPAYNRLDLGFSKMIFFKTSEERKRKHGFESLWLTLEVFNLFQRANTVSYLWIKDIFNTQFAVPNYLSSRMINFRVVAKF